MLRSFLNRIFAEGSKKGANDGGMLWRGPIFLGILLMSGGWAHSQTVSLMPDYGTATTVSAPIVGNVLTNDSCVAGTTNGAAIWIGSGTNSGGVAPAMYVNTAYRSDTSTYKIEASKITLSTTAANKYVGNIKFVGTDINATTFSGNNVNGYLYLPGATQSLPGTISRQFKGSGNTTESFYFAQTEADFTQLKNTSYYAYMLVTPTYEAGFTGGGTYGTSSDPSSTELNRYIISGAVFAISPAASAGEGNPITFSVTRSINNNSTNTVAFQTSNGTATSGVNYTGTNNTLIFLPGETIKTIVVNTFSNAATAGNLTFALTLSSPGGVASIDPTYASGTGTIVDTTLKLISYIVSGQAGTNTVNTNTATIITNKGSISMSSNGAFTFTPVTNWSGIVPTISYMVNLGTEPSNTSTLNLAITKASSTVTMTGSASFTYSGAPQGPDTSDTTGSTGGVTYGYAGTSGTSYVPSTIKPTDVGSYEATATLAADSNYDGATSSAYGFTISPRPVTITADPKSKISGDSDPTLTSQFTVGSIEGRDVLSGSLIRAEGETPGKYAIISTFSNGNYAITFVSADLTILDGVNPTANEDRLVPVPIKTSKFHVLEVLANDTDLLKRSLTVTAVSALSELGGTVELRGGWILYTPPPGLASGVEDSFTYTLSNGVGNAQGTVYLLAVEWAMTDAMNILSVTDSASGKDVTFSAIPNFVYEVFATSSLTPANWSKLGDYTADAQGILRVNDVAAGSSRFYRMRSQP